MGADRRQKKGYRKGLKYHTLKSLLSLRLEFENSNYQNCRPFQQAFGPQAVFFCVKAPLCIKEIPEDRRYPATHVVKELDDEVTVIALVGQEQTLWRKHDCECAFRRWVRPDYAFVLLVHWKGILLLHTASLP